MASAGLTPLTSIVSATGWSNATTTALNTSDNSRATGGTAGEVILAELADAPADYGSGNHVVFSVEWLLSGTASRAKSILMELVSADGLTVYATYTTPTKTSTTEITSTSGNQTISGTPNKAALDAARLRITVQEAGGMADSVSVSIDAVTATLDYDVAAVAVEVTPGVGEGTWTGFSPTVVATAHRAVTPGLGAATWEGFAPTATATTNVAVTPGLAVATWTGFAPTVQVSQSAEVTPGLGEGTWEGFAPTVGIGVNVTPDLGVASWTGFEPDVAVSEHVLVTPGVGTGSWTGFAPSVVASGASPGRGRAACSGPRAVKAKPRHWVFVEVGDDGKPKKGKRR